MGVLNREAVSDVDCMIEAGQDIALALPDRGKSSMPAAIIALSLVVAAPAVTLAGADTEPVIVVPGRPGVPVMINGQDVSGAVIEADWGLARPQIGITIIRPPPLYPPYVFAPAGRYYPHSGRAPRLGRVEIRPRPDRPLPTPAPTFMRSFEAYSAPLAPTLTQPYTVPQVLLPRNPASRRHDVPTPE
jgi:hypothetical protein